MASSLVWDITVPAVAGTVLLLQALALPRGNPLSRWLRRKLGIEPKQWWRWVTIPGLWSFLVWFGIHITTPYL